MVSAATERRRIDEAKMLVEKVCTNVEGASLASEFARCEEAEVLLENYGISTLRVLESSLHSIWTDTLDMAKSGTFAMMQVGLVLLFLLHGPASVMATRNGDTNRLKQSLYSPIALTRMHTALNLGLDDCCKNEYWAMKDD